jgi:hypothetical protein
VQAFQPHPSFSARGASTTDAVEGLTHTQAFETEFRRLASRQEVAAINPIPTKPTYTDLLQRAQICSELLPTLRQEYADKKEDDEDDEALATICELLRCGNILDIAEEKVLNQVEVLEKALTERENLLNQITLLNSVSASSSIHSSRAATPNATPHPSRSPSPSLPTFPTSLTSEIIYGHFVVSSREWPVSGSGSKS